MSESRKQVLSVIFLTVCLILTLISGYYIFTNQEYKDFRKQYQYKKTKVVSKKAQSTTKAFLGIEYEDAIVRIIPGSPAEKAGLKEGDFLVCFYYINKEGYLQLGYHNDLMRILLEQKPGDVMSVDINRAGRRRTLNVQLGEWPKETLE